MHQITQVWLAPDDVRQVTLVDHDLFKAPGLVDIKIGDTTLSLTEGTLRSGDALETLRAFAQRLLALTSQAEGQRGLRKTVDWDAADEAVTDHETATILREEES